MCVCVCACVCVCVCVCACVPINMRSSFSFSFLFSFNFLVTQKHVILSKSVQRLKLHALLYYQYFIFFFFSFFVFFFFFFGGGNSRCILSNNHCSSKGDACRVSQAGQLPWAGELSQAQPGHRQLALWQNTQLAEELGRLASWGHTRPA